MSPQATDELAGRLRAAFSAESGRRVAAMHRDVVALQDAAGRAVTQRLLEALTSETHSLRGAAEAAGAADAHLLAGGLERLFERLRRDEVALGPESNQVVLRALDTIGKAAAGPVEDAAAIVAALDALGQAVSAPAPAAKRSVGSQDVVVARAKLESLTSAIAEVVADIAAAQRRLAQLQDMADELAARLPDSPTVHEQPAGAAPEADPGPPVVLIAENSETTRAMQRHLLEHAGYEVWPAGDGSEAWDLLADGGVDLVISDIQMPAMDGLALTAKIRANPRLSHLPVILVTTTDAPGQRQRSQELGADAYFVKGSPEYLDLLKTVERLRGTP